ncbi:MAG TPA: DUF4012 domain-containing protein, partial [Patescibacteria group bacterium]|nr:DUF4012 domain-containing protein [Patescibacteria group bacterium]
AGDAAGGLPPRVVPSTVENRKRQDPREKIFSQSQNIVKSLALFFLFAILFVLPASVSAVLYSTHRAETIITQSTEEAYMHLQAGGEHIQAMNFQSAQEQFQAALQSFQQAQIVLQQQNRILLTLASYIPIKGKTIRSGRSAIEAGKQLSQAGEQLSKTLMYVSSADLTSALQDQQKGVTDVLVALHSGLAPAVEHINAANNALQRVSVDVVPKDKRELFSTAQKTLPSIQQTLTEYLEITEESLSFFGHTKAKRYLVLFANNRELRPAGGGFPGSFGVFDIARGVVKRADIPGGGIYDVAGQSQMKIISPVPLHLINPHWNIQDALWFPHYPTSAQKVEWFLEHANDGISVDGVISLVPDVVEKLLQITGPIDMTEKYGVVISTDNFYDIVQAEAEKKFDENPESKRIISEMTPLLFQQLFSSVQNSQSLLKLLSTIQDALEKKDIVVYMNDPAIQQLFSQHNWSGELMETNKDYLHINIANIGGGKTSQAIESTALLQTHIQEDGSVINTLTLTSVHKGSELDTFENRNNSSFVRFYVPQKSEILSVEGFQYPNQKLFFTPDGEYKPDEDLQKISGNISVNPTTQVYTNVEFNKQVIGGWLMTPVHGSSTVTISYRLPFTINMGKWWNRSDYYSLLVQKQSGYVLNLSTQLILPSSIRIARSSPATFNESEHRLLEKDYFFGVILERQ